MKRGSKTDDILSLIFILLAVAAGVCYFATTGRTAFWIIGGIAVVFRLVQYALRFF
jgi:membrane-bound ClpP family serine protease